MTFKIQSFLLIIIISLIASCQFLNNAKEFTKTTQEFTEALIAEDYDKCINLFALEHEIAQSLNVDTLRNGLPGFRQVIIDNFGEDLEYSLMAAEKTFSTIEGNSTPPKTTSVQVQFSNQVEFGVLKVLFDDTSKKILNINAENLKLKIPNMFPFWFFGFITIWIPIFNIYVINKIRKSKLKRKWLKYLGVLIFNVPTFTYSAINGLSFKLIYFQFMFGFSFGYMGYLNSMWAFGIPLGGMYWLWKIKTKKENKEFASNEFPDDNILDDFGKSEEE